jgi:hypothetical protein
MVLQVVSTLVPRSGTFNNFNRVGKSMIKYCTPLFKTVAALF